MTETPCAFHLLTNQSDRVWKPFRTPRVRFSSIDVQLPGGSVQLVVAVVRLVGDRCVDNLYAGVFYYIKDFV